MKYLYLFLLVFFSLDAIAVEYRCRHSEVGFSYLSSQQKKGEKSRAVALRWIKGDNASLFHYPSLNISESWYQAAGGRISFTRVFHQDSRGIEYQPSDIVSLGANTQWQQISAPFDGSLLQQLSQVSTRKSGCDQVSKYRGEIDGVRYWVEWLNAWDAPLKVVARKPGVTTRLKLQNILDRSSIRKHWDALEGIHYIDYSDIGDNEADPQIAKMIRLGFIEQGESAPNIHYPGHAH